ncbi:hypothetical protein CDD82_1200 [Ophiocordyceps australis]|uniref:Uncharacterized protein n=1 Tax=Ophiocordyceps australis TaxID=1399860 RepID=A0A2C5YJM4_9HYPO|nr:hypothetical protein CDD82_1200 [Ophiocordyceps australis]
MYCDSVLSYQALFSLLPDQMQLDIWNHWGANQHHLGALLYMEELSQQQKFILDSYAWYRAAASSKRRVCWHLDFLNQFEYYQSSLGAVNNLFLAEEWERYDMPRHFADLPIGYIRIGDPLCYNSTNLQYQWLQKQIKWMVKSRNNGKQEEYHTIDDLRKDFLDWPGTLGQAMEAMLHETYTCAPTVSCERVAGYGVPYTPTSYTNFLDQLKTVLNLGAKICFALTNYLPDDQSLISAYWFLPGIQLPEDRNRYDYY